MHRMLTDRKSIVQLELLLFETRNKANDLVARRLLDLPSIQPRLVLVFEGEHCCIVLEGEIGI
jgi:hypothetical protein